MNDERRYSEKEIAAIFKYASREQELASKNRPAGEGLSLSELQRIGEDAGITPEFIERAATALDAAGSLPASDTLLGFPLVVSREMKLSRKLKEVEWEQLIVDLRRTFKAYGTIKQEGSFRQWSHGEISVFIEPSGAGENVRMTTAPQKKGATKLALSLSGLVFLVSLFYWLQALYTGQFIARIVAPATFFSVAGLLAFFPLFLAPRWAKKRKDELEGLAMRLRSQMRKTDEMTVQSDIEGSPAAVRVDPSPTLELEGTASEFQKNDPGKRQTRLHA